jgi:hypothetical protein
MLLPLFVLVIITVVLVIAYQNTKKNDTTTKTFLILSYIVVLGICFKFGVIQNNKFLEGFEVEIPDTDDMINNSPTTTSEDDDTGDDMVDDMVDDTADDMADDMVDDMADDTAADTEFEPLDEDLVTLNNNSRNNNSSNSNNKAYKGATLNDLAKLENINSPLNNLKSQANNATANNTNRASNNNNSNRARNNNARASNNNNARASNNNNANRASNNNSNRARNNNNANRASNNNSNRARNNNATNVTREGFNDIVQHDTNGTSSVFRPQIIINTNDGLKTDEMNMNIPNVNLNLDLNMDNTDNNDNNDNNDNTESMSNIPFNKNQRSRFMSANNKANLFNNNSIKSTESEQEASNIIYNVNQEQKEDAFTWLNEFTNKRQHGTDNSRSYTTHNTLNNNSTGTSSNNKTAESFNNGNSNSRQCATFRPYAVETGAGPVFLDYDRQTLTNRTYIPGVQYMPPTTWHVPQPHMHTQCRNVCNNTMVNTRALPIAMMDRGTPVNALEIGYDGTIAKTEEEVRLTNIGSILPKFEYREYIDCYENPYANSATTTTTTTTASNSRTPVSLD